MNRTLQHITAALLVGSYGLSVTVSGAFHTHYQPSCHWYAACPGSDLECCDHDRGESAPCHRDVPSGDQETGNRARSSLGSQAESCPVCSFLAHKPMPSAFVFVADCTLFAPMRACPKAVARIDEPLSAIWSRGPPPVA